MKHGWFEIPGVQTGERTLDEQIVGLEPLLVAANGASVLDVGCAEGLIGKWLVDVGGAAQLHGLEQHLPYVETAQQQLARYPATICEVNLDEFEAWAVSPCGVLRAQYDIVLALNILQKLKEPEQLLRHLAGMCGNLLALSLPADVVRDRRSDFKSMDPVQVLSAEFDRISVRDGLRHAVKGFYGRRMIFKRRAK